MMPVPNSWRLDMHEVGQLYFQLLDQKNMLNRYMEIVNNNPTLMQERRQRNPWFELGPLTWYAYYSCLVLRNIGDDDDRTVSFYNILTKMGHARYLRHMVFAGGSTLTQKAIFTDRKTVKDTIKPIKTFADRVIAHKERGWLTITPPTFNEVETCMNGLQPVVFKYMNLLLGASSTAYGGPKAGWDSIFAYKWV